MPPRPGVRGAAAGCLGRRCVWGAGLPGVEGVDEARLLPALHYRTAGPDADGALVVYVPTLPVTFTPGGRERGCC